MLKIENNNLLWRHFEIVDLKKNKFLIGFNIFVYYKILGRVKIINGMCIEKTSKKNGLLMTKIKLIRKIHNSLVFFLFFLYFGSSFKYRITGYNYKRRKIKTSKIAISKLLNK